MHIMRIRNVQGKIDLKKELLVIDVKTNEKLLKT